MRNESNFYHPFNIDPVVSYQKWILSCNFSYLDLNNKIEWKMQTYYDHHFQDLDIDIEQGSDQNPKKISVPNLGCHMLIFLQPFFWWMPYEKFSGCAKYRWICMILSLVWKGLISDVSNISAQKSSKINIWTMNCIDGMIILIDYCWLIFLGSNFWE